MADEGAEMLREAAEGVVIALKWYHQLSVENTLEKHNLEAMYEAQEQRSSHAGRYRPASSKINHDGVGCPGQVSPRMRRIGGSYPASYVAKAAARFGFLTAAESRLRYDMLANLTTMLKQCSRGSWEYRNIQAR